MMVQKVGWGLWAVILLFVSMPALATQTIPQDGPYPKDDRDIAQSATGDSGTKSMAFGSSSKSEESVAPGDFKAMLGVCDGKLDTCQKDAVGITFLAAAYMALWLILMAFVYVTQKGQKRLQSELEDLSGRLRDLEGGAA